MPNPQVRTSLAAQRSSREPWYVRQAERELEVGSQTASGATERHPIFPRKSRQGFQAGEGCKLTFVKDPFEYRVENGVDGVKNGRKG